jgi:hypothetical protein
MENSGIVSQLDHDHFFPNNFQWIIRLSLHNGHAWVTSQQHCFAVCGCINMTSAENIYHLPPTNSIVLVIRHCNYSVPKLKHKNTATILGCVTINGVWTEYWIYWHLMDTTRSYKWYSAIAELHTTLGSSVFTSLPVTAAHHEVFFAQHNSFLVISSQSSSTVVSRDLLSSDPLVKVKVTLRLAVCRQSVRLGVKPIETHDQRFFLWTLAVIVLM